MDVFDKVRSSRPICTADGRDTDWIPTLVARRGRTPHRFQPVFDRAEDKERHDHYWRALMLDYANNGSHFWDGRNQRC